MASLLYEFGECRLIPDTRTLWRGSEPIPLTSREFDTIFALVLGAGAPVATETLARKIWGDTVVNDVANNLSKQVGAVRNKLGNSPTGQSYIQTVPNRGYMLTTPVTIRTIPNDSIPEQRAKINTPENPITTTAPGVASYKPKQIGLIVGFATVLLICLAAFVLTNKNSWRRSPRLSIAVLPFTAWPATPDGDDLAAIVTEMIRTELALSENLRPVSGEDISRFMRSASLPSAGTLAAGTLTRIRQNLNSNFVISGSITRIADSGEIRIDARIQDVSRDDILAAETVTGVQASLLDLIRRCGSLLRARMGATERPRAQQEALAETVPASVEAAELYIRGLARLRTSDALGARPLLELASQTDPRSAMIRSALAETWAVLGYEVRARDEARKAFEASRRLPREQQLIVEGRYHELARDWAQAATAYGALWTFFPDDLEHGLRLVRVETAEGKQPEANRTISEMRKTASRDDARIDLAAAANAEAIGNFQPELAAAEQAIQKGQNTGNRVLMARALLKSSWALNYLGKRTIAREQAEKAAAEFAALGDRGGEGQAIRLKADVLDDANDHMAALPFFEKALATFRSIGYESEVAKTLNGMGYALKDLGQAEDARKRFEESAQVSRNIGDAALEALGLNGLGGVLWRQGRLAEAETIYQKALGRFRDAGQENHTATVLGNLALVDQDQGKLADAQSSLDQSLEILKRLGDQTGIARTYGNLGELLLRCGDPIGALAKFNDQLSIGQKINERKQQAYALQGLGAVYLMRADYERARKILSDALVLRTQTGDEELAAETKLTLAEMAVGMNDQNAADTAGSLATYFEKEKRTDEAAFAQSLVIRAALNHRPPDMAHAAAGANSARATLPHIEDRSIHLSVKTELAEYDSLTGNESAAKRDLREILREASEGGYRLQELEASLVLAGMERNRQARTQTLQQIEIDARKQGLLNIAQRAGRLKSQN